MTYISVRNWRKFQHYDPAKRTPPWIKNMTELMSSDAYLGLSAAQRGVLHGVWLEYARSRCELPGDTLNLTRRLSVKVSRATLAALNHAGFIDIVASKTLAEGYQPASARARATETEEEAETEIENGSSTVSYNPTVTVTPGSGQGKNEQERETTLIPDLLKEIPW